MEDINILLVEDCHQDATLIKEALQETNIQHNLVTVSNGEDALQTLYTAEYQPSLIFLDLNLPKMSGIEVLKEIKHDSRLRPIPVIILTNSMSEDDVIRAYANHCNAYVRKPLGFEQLLAELNLTCTFWFNTATLPRRRGL